MKDRTTLILKFLIEKFISNGVPVSSQKLLEGNNLKVSSATIRNELSALESVGLIKSQHVSSGKIPTEKGFRFFVDELAETNNKEEEDIRDIFKDKFEEYKDAKFRENIFDLLQVIASCSGNTAFAIFDGKKSFYIGLSNVLKMPEFYEKPSMAAKIIEVFEQKDNFIEKIKLLPVNKNEVKAFIGRENLIKEISSCSLILTKFENKYVSGILGILGPTRMNYTKNKAIIRNATNMIF